MKLPSAWDTITLGRAGRWISGGTPNTSNPAYWGGDIPWISSGSLTSFRLKDSERKVTELGARNGTRMVDAGTILIVVRGMSLKTEIRIGIAQRRVAFGQDCKALVAGDGIDAEFLGYAITERRPYLLSLVDEAGHGTGRINSDQLYAVRIPVPPIREQKSIAKFLRSFDDKIAANDNSMRIARELSDTLLARLLRVENAAPITLGALAGEGAIEFSDGYRTKRSEHGLPGLRIVRAGDVRNSRIFPDGPDSVSSQYIDQIGGKRSQGGDIVLTTKGTVGRVAVVPSHMEQVVYSPQMCYFRVLDRRRVNLGYLAAWFNSRDLLDQLSLVMNKSDMAPYVNLQDIRSLRVPLPSIHVQETEGATHFALLNLSHALAKENDYLVRTRNELLPLVMSGKIRVNDEGKPVEGMI